MIKNFACSISCSFQNAFSTMEKSTGSFDPSFGNTVGFMPPFFVITLSGACAITEKSNGDLSKVAATNVVPPAARMSRRETLTPCSVCLGLFFISEPPDSQRNISYEQKDK